MYVVVHDFAGPKQTPGCETYQYLHQALERIMLVAGCTCKSDPMLLDTNSLEGGVAWNGHHWSPVSPETKVEWLRKLKITV